MFGLRLNYGHNVYEEQRCTASYHIACHGVHRSRIIAAERSGDGYVREVLKSRALSQRRGLMAASETEV